MRAIAVGTLIALLAGVNACGPAVQTGPKSPGANGTTAPVHPVAVSDADFAASTYQVLISGERNPKRTDLLVGVVQRQLERAKQRFDSGHAKAGLAALTGALYLVRTGELHAEMFEHASDALSDGAREVARVGNEGRAFALYKTLERVLPPGPQRKDVEGHLAALAKWDRIAAGSGPMQAAGSRQRTAIERALFAPSKPTMDAARKATVAWVQKALSFNAADVPIRSNFDREEAIEAYHAIRAGGAALVALYLRNGDAAGALDAVDKADLSRVVPPGLSDRLQRAAEDDDPAAWTDLYHLFQSAVASERPETGLDADLARAAAWGSALELYRSQPGSPQAAMALAGLMLHYGMAEAAPLVLAGALGSKPSANDLGSAMALVLQAMIAEDDIGQHAAVRRAFAAARPILRLAESKQMVGRVRPSAARLHYVMGALETQAGALAQARPELEASVKEQPSVGCYKLLAAIDRQRGSTDQALESLKQVIQLAAKTGDRADEADAWLSTFEIERDKGQSAKARSALATALVRALDARKLAHSLADQAVAERLLARILDLYGNTRARTARNRAGLRGLAQQPLPARGHDPRRGAPRAVAGRPRLRAQGSAEGRRCQPGRRGSRVRGPLAQAAGREAQGVGGRHGRTGLRRHRRVVVLAHEAQGLGARQARRQGAFGRREEPRAADRSQVLRCHAAAGQRRLRGGFAAPRGGRQEPSHRTGRGRDRP